MKFIITITRANPWAVMGQMGGITSTAPTIPAVLRDMAAKFEYKAVHRFTRQLEELQERKANEIQPSGSDQGLPITLRGDLTDSIPG